MICVTIGRGRHKQMMAEHQQMVELGAELVELRVDYIVRNVNVKRLIQDRPGPVVVTCRRQRDGGKWNGEEEDRLTLLRSAIADQVEYVDLEEDIAEKIPRFGSTKRIVSLHDFEQTPEDLDDIHARLSELDPDIVKIATLANNPHDNLRMMELVKRSEIPTIGICMGDMGTPSRILAGKYGAPFTFATYNRDRVMAPGQLSFQDMRDIYNYDSIGPDTEVFGVIADPVGHSLSPLIHNAAFLHKGMNRVYLPFRVPTEHIEQFMDDCPARGIRGLSVTIPHKESVLKYCQQVNKAVQGIGATNTIVFGGSPTAPTRSGFNTDFKAAMNCLDSRLGTAERKTPLAGHVALVLGAGGAARAIAFGLIRRGADVVVTSRTHGRAIVLAEELGCRAVDWESRHKVKHEVLINATPVGMHPKMDASPYDKMALRPNSLVFDTVYNPEQTLLIKQARAKNCRVITGMEMFVGQAALQFEHFTGEPAPVDVMKDRIKQAIGAVKYTPATETKKSALVSLIGYRGTGKRRLQSCWRSDCSVSLRTPTKFSKPNRGVRLRTSLRRTAKPIFANWKQRRLRGIVDKNASKQFVLATGGGVILSAENRDVLQSSGSVIWLIASPEVIHQRLNADADSGKQRPNLTADGGLIEIQNMLTAREPLYRMVSRRAIHTDGKTPAEIVDAIQEWLASSK